MNISYEELTQVIETAKTYLQSTDSDDIDTETIEINILILKMPQVSAQHRSPVQLTPNEQGAYNDLQSYIKQHNSELDNVSMVVNLDDPRNPGGLGDSAPQVPRDLQEFDDTIQRAIDNDILNMNTNFTDRNHILNALNISRENNQLTLTPAQKEAFERLEQSMLEITITPARQAEIRTIIQNMERYKKTGGISMRRFKNSERAKLLNKIKEKFGKKNDSGTFSVRAAITSTDLNDAIGAISGYKTALEKKGKSSTGNFNTYVSKLEQYLKRYLQTNKTSASSFANRGLETTTNGAPSRKSSKRTLKSGHSESHFNSNGSNFESSL